ncbi:hypothetical protein M408DRAFT_252923 [Serendipita vermifera MAFF 305830]|uniref:Protein kinase domain-containing protein n=1 Tax=Serendipita vermifera MAFF 305830 TaxID=933852 RepID=A0A0C2X264_SERVB|nr:hypothetical protein M408DRAFT_252923 [Serendipita vermifera MAFF 305830]
MPSFYLRFEDACASLHKASQQPEEWDSLAASWAIFRKIASHLDSGAGSSRFENLARRLGYLQQRSSKEQNSQQYHINNSLGQVSSVNRSRTPKLDTRFASSNSFTNTGLDSPRQAQGPRIHTDQQFSGLGPISLLATAREPTSKPIIQLSLDHFASDIYAPTHLNDLTTVHDIRNDPNEIYIIPSALPPTPFSLQSIPEGSDDEFEEDTVVTPGPPLSGPVLFVNPFGAPNRNAQMPSPPQTPSMSENIPPHLNDEEEDEDMVSGSEPINLTGRIKKLMDPPIALGGTSDIFYGEWRLPVPKRVAVKVLRTTSTNSVETVQRVCVSNLPGRCSHQIDRGAQRLRREMRLWWMCRHRNVVPLYGFASDFGGMDAMVSPWMKNGSALCYIQAQKCSWAERLKLLGDIVAGLKYLHHFQPPIVHGDLKPTNVLIADNGDACLCDFGLSRLIKTETGASGFTTSNFAGSIRYMSPELLNSEDEEALPLVTTASDVYALGCVGLQIVTDHLPYANRNLDAQVMHDIIRGFPPARRPSLAGGMKTGGKHSLPKFWDLLTVTWAADPARRPDVVQVSRILSECRMPPQGPQLRTEQPVMVNNIGHSPTYRARPEPARASLGVTSTTTTTTSRGLSRSSSLGAQRERGRLASVFRAPMSASSSVSLDRSLGADQRRTVGPSFSSGSSSTTTTETVASALAAVPALGLKRSRSAGSSASSSTASLLLLPSADKLHRLRRSTGAVLKGSLRRVSSSTNPSPSFRPSLDATEQVWHDG